LLIGGFTINDTTSDPTSKLFVSTVKHFSYMFILAHGIMCALRLKWTLSKWQVLIFCEIAKGMMVVFLLWGTSIMHEQGTLGYDTPEYGCLMGFVAVLLTVSLVRVVWAIREKCNVDAFNASYFGTVYEKEQKAERSYLMCCVLESKSNKLLPSLSLGHAH